ncbi:uncharacterized protein LOC129586322 [Paramacrobiotus metropolitanus]|uniref:uncharacterized protein LOC129586322 n=1 Tax=Paramacrobiotus metropolitanus TaxID=2943436 RepID=UPI002445CF91|nr:uncharacterized protein LOC129586322 [Paramacrobiotus metropolitanus]XP_055335457.1 uncharacterized protein LOC129586322 [Paramacrobiotus metropolitanus]
MTADIPVSGETDRLSRIQNLFQDTAAPRPTSTYSDKVKVGNWYEDQIQRQYRGDLLSNIQPLSYDWDISGKVGSCDDHVRKNEYQEKMLGDVQHLGVPPNICEVKPDTCFPEDGKGLEAPQPRRLHAPYNELDDPRWNWVFDKNDEDNSNGMKTNFGNRANHPIYEGSEPAFKIPPVCQHKRDFFPVNINWGLGFDYRKKVAEENNTDKNRWITTYRLAYWPVPLQPYPYVDPPCLPRQKPLVFYRRPELGNKADVPISPALQRRPPRGQ